MELARKRKPARTGEVTAHEFRTRTECFFFLFFLMRDSEWYSIVLSRLKDFYTWDVICLRSSCGLAEELEDESKGKEKANLPKSACGSVSIITRLFYIKRRKVFSFLFSPWDGRFFIVVVLPWWCVPMCQLSICRNASVQTWREDSAGQEDVDRCLKRWNLHKTAHDDYIPSFQSTSDLKLHFRGWLCRNSWWVGGFLFETSTCFTALFFIQKTFSVASRDRRKEGKHELLFIMQIIMGKMPKEFASTTCTEN